MRRTFYGLSRMFPITNLYFVVGFRLLHLYLYFGVSLFSLFRAPIGNRVLFILKGLPCLYKRYFINMHQSN